ncbi:RNase adapter RapZ [Nigerium massiliense]|uniref:RNase adapter RapZ n=1 Tax=Nigerium massiliense TaxID=1522317 RepID=UPI00058B6A52|nr:RNase adapter RapZ [Nigerium massiliense]
MSEPGVRFVVVTGMSGAGRRTAAHTLEDFGWYVVDNLPPSMLPELLDTALERGFNRVAVIIDVRTRSEFDELPAAFDTLARRGVLPQILFLEAPDDVIVRRQESVRRPHPLQGDGVMLDGIKREREMLAVLRAAADMVIDTGRLNVHQLASRVAYAFNPDVSRGLHVTVLSFGFKNGLPMDADVVLDVRFLPNPHWVPDLRPQTGLSQAVSSYVLGFDEAREYLDSVERMLLTMTPGYVREGKRLATVAIGCTGGKHRSTAMAEELSRRLNAAGVDSNVLHRDLGLE